jgi:hypothetical protein
MLICSLDFTGLGLMQRTYCVRVCVCVRVREGARVCARVCVCVRVWRSIVSVGIDGTDAALAL